MAQRDDGLDKLEAFIAALAATQSDFQDNADRVNRIDNELYDLDQAEKVIDGLDKAVARFTDSFVARHQEILGGLDELSGALDKGLGERLGKADTLVEEVGKGFDEAFEQHQSRLQASFDTPAELAYQGALDARVQWLDGVAETAAEQAKGAFADLESAVLGLEKEVERARTETFESFQDAENIISDNETGVWKKTFDESTDAVEAAGRALEAGLGDVVTGLREAFRALSQAAETTAEMVTMTGTTILGDNLDHLKDDLMVEMENWFKEAAEIFVADFLVTASDAASGLTAGVALTTALAALMPPLGTAKKVVGTINDLLDMMNVG